MADDRPEITLESSLRKLGVPISLKSGLMVGTLAGGSFSQIAASANPEDTIRAESRVLKGSTRVAFRIIGSEKDPVTLM